MIHISRWLPALVMVLAGCSSAADAPDPNTGSVSLALESNGVTLDSITYTIKGRGFTRISVVNVEHSTTISALIGGLPVGSFTVTLKATDASDASTECTGSGKFEILARQTTSTSVNLYCRKSANTGSVAISGEVVRCPTIESVSAEPSETTVGSSIAVYATADDPQLHFGYAWTASSGSLAAADFWHPTLTCTVPGPVTLNLVVTLTDGACRDTASVTVHCTADSAPPLGDDPDTVGDDRAGFTSCGSNSCGPGTGCCTDIVACGADNQQCESPFAFQTCDGPEDCPIPGQKCAIHPHFIACDVPSAYYGIFCHKDSDCISTPEYPNPCTDGTCHVPIPE